MTTPSDIITYLSSLKNAVIIRILPCYVTIGRQTYPAARYIERLNHTPGTRAYSEGKRTYEREMILCAGMLPSIKLRGNVAFVIDGETSEWYVAAYSGKVKNRTQETAPPNEYHPWGNDFLLTPWDIPGEPIDKYARKRYPRATAQVSNNSEWHKRFD